MAERVRAKELLNKLGMSERRQRIYGEGIDRGEPFTVETVIALVLFFSMVKVAAVIVTLCVSEYRTMATAGATLRESA